MNNWNFNLILFSSNFMEIVHELYKNYLDSSSWRYEAEKLVHVYIVIIPRKDEWESK